jgi:uncharacterized OsmC-like protein
MADPHTIRTAFERSVRAMSLRPSIAAKTASTRITVRDGTTCDVENGAWRFTADVGRDAGGNDAGPGPGVLMRAALGSCLAIGYATWAAVRGVPIDSLEVEVETDGDARAQFGLADEPPGYRAVRCRVRVSSPAPEEEVLRVLDEADARSPVLDDFRRPLPVSREVSIVAAAEAAVAEPAPAEAAPVEVAP